MRSPLDKLPKYLKCFIAPQNYHLYNAQNQAVWRYVMRMNLKYLKNRAHSSYIKGLEDTGISIESIPSMEEMNEKLSKIGWAAVAVDGFIPPNAFMAFQAYQVLVIAADIRTLEHIQYTPAPDIIHEAAGHAPIIANPEYAEYLRRFGEIGSKAISSAHDHEVYETIRHLSILKENPHADQKAVEKAEAAVLTLQQKQVHLSEMAQIRNLHWWTVEYGLVGTVDHPKIYGAGLLSSISESETCMQPSVAKRPYTIEAAKQDFDITKPQPQLYVTPDFAHLNMVLEAFADQMALRKGGLKGVKKLIASQSLGTVTLSTGLQVSGVFTNVIADDDNRVAYIQTTGTTALAYHEKELIAHGTDSHKDGFGSPVGKLKGFNLAIEDMSPSDLKAYGIYEGTMTTLTFESGVEVSGEIITGIRNIYGKILLISFKNCTVTYGDTVLFEPSWGIYDMAVGKTLTSAFAGPADDESFDSIYEPPTEKTIKITYSPEEKQLHEYYAQVRQMRVEKRVDEVLLTDVFEILTRDYPKDWLLPLEIYEILPQGALKDRVKAHLEQFVVHNKYAQLISDGLSLIS